MKRLLFSLFRAAWKGISREGGLCRDVMEWAGLVTKRVPRVVGWVVLIFWPVPAVILLVPKEFGGAVFGIFFIVMFIWIAVLSGIDEYRAGKGRYRNRDNDS